MEKSADAINKYKIITRIIVLGVFGFWLYCGVYLLRKSGITDLHVRIFDIATTALIWILVLYLIRRTLENPDIIGKIVDKLPSK